MRISRVHIEAELVEGAEITLDKSQSHYLKHVLRLTSGAALFLFNGREAVDYAATLVLDGKKASALIGVATPLSTESKLRTELIQGLGRADHMDWMIQKTTELGVNRIALFNSERTQSPLKPAQIEKKLGHWYGVAVSACEQCGRAVLPEIDFHDNLIAAVSTSTGESRLLLDFEGAALVTSLNPVQVSVSILLGAEGGLNSVEIETARAAGFASVRLGTRVLRTETAATAALAIVQSCLGDLA